MKIPNKVAHYGLEFLTVFLGVSLSLVAENWRQRQSDTNAEHNSLVRLYNDLGNEGRDVRTNSGRAESGLASARWLLANRARGHSVDSVSAALTGVGTCSFFVPYTSEYTALKSSGRLSIIEDAAIRERVVRFYEGDSFVQWMHERDCLQTTDLVDSLLGRVDFMEADTTTPPPQSRVDSVAADTTRRGRGARGRADSGRAGFNTSRGRPDSLRGRSDSLRARADSLRGNGRGRGGGAVGIQRPGSDRRYPVVVFHAGQEALLDDPVLRGRFVRLATQRRYMIGQLQGRLTEITDLRAQIKTRLGSDTLMISERSNSSNGQRRGFRRP